MTVVPQSVVELVKILSLSSRLLQILPTLHKSAPPAVGRGAGTHVVLDVLQKIQSLPYQLKVEGSREGIWLLSHYCTPTKAVTVGSYVYCISSSLRLPPGTGRSEGLAGAPDCTGSGMATSIS